MTIKVIASEMENAIAFTQTLEKKVIRKEVSRISCAGNRTSGTRVMFDNTSCRVIRF